MHEKPPRTLLMPKGFIRGLPSESGCYLLISRRDDGGFRLDLADVMRREVGGRVRFTGVRVDYGDRVNLFPLTCNVIAYRLIDSLSVEQVAKATEFFDDL